MLRTEQGSRSWCPGPVRVPSSPSVLGGFQSPGQAAATAGTTVSVRAAPTKPLPAALYSRAQAGASSCPTSHHCLLHALFLLLTFLTRSSSSLPSPPLPGRVQVNPGAHFLCRHGKVPSPSSGAEQGSAPGHQCLQPSASFSLTQHSLCSETDEDTQNRKFNCSEERPDPAHGRHGGCTCATVLKVSRRFQSSPCAPAMHCH